jgi:cellobiose-specific phosphotransferase system component IIA
MLLSATKIENLALYARIANQPLKQAHMLSHALTMMQGMLNKMDFTILLVHCRN